MTVALTNRDQIPSFNLTPSDLSFLSISPLLTMSFTQYMYPILLFSKNRHVLLLTRSRSLYLPLRSPYPISLSAQFRTSLITPQILYQFLYRHQDQAFQSTLTNSNLKVISPHSTVSSWKYARLSHILVTDLCTYCHHHHHLTPGFAIRGFGYT
jgi:hypothetical protein